MQTITTIRSVPAIIGGSISATVAWCSITRGIGYSELTLDHATAAGFIGLSVLAGHLAGQSWHARKHVAAAALIAVSVLGSFLTVYNAVGSRAETRDVKVAAVELSTSERARIEADLAKTTRLVAEAETWVGAECKTGKGTKCEGVTFVLNQRKASQTALQGQLKTVGPIAPAEPKAAQAGLLAGLLGYNAKLVQSFASALEPVAAPLFFEVVAILLFLVGLGHKPVARFPTIADTRQTSFFAGEIKETDCPTPPSNGGTRQSNVVQLHPVVEALQRAGNPVSNRDLAHLMNVSDGESSKRWQEVRDQLDIGREGKELRISLKRTA